LPVYGDGGNVRDWLYVDDHVEAIWRVLRRGPRGSTYNVGGRAERSNLDLLAELIAVTAEVSGRDVEELRRLVTFVQDRPGHDRRYAIDAARIEADLGWRPAHDLGPGLRETVRWYLENQAWVARRLGA
jgi:dTDP-glucose 4,6-dehydratase